MMVIFEELLLICTAPIQAFFCNLFPILLLLQHSHQNFHLDVYYSTPEILKYLLLIFHFLPQIILIHLSCLEQTSFQPRTCTHLLALSSGCPCFIHPILNFWFYLIWSCRQTSCGVSSCFFILYSSVTSASPVLFFHPCPSCKTQKTVAAEERSE